MKSQMVSLAGVLLLVFGAFLAGRLTTPAQSAAAPKGPAEGYEFRFLEVGKTYRFQWQGTAQGGTLAEVPRAGWVKIKVPVAGGPAPLLWINLATVESIREDGPGK
jgi:hypothetical protein